MAPCDQAFLRQGQTLKGGRVTLAEGDIDSIEGLWRIPLFNGGEAGMTEEVVRAIQGTGIQPERGCGVDTEWQQQRVFNGKPKDALLKHLPHILSVGAVTADMWSW
jgi:hypothetical protein